MQNFSQNNEQEIILNYFGTRVGSFLDIGAHDGVTFSNTRALLLKRWHGVLVEPSPSVYPRLVENCQGHRAITINKALTVEYNGLRTGFKDSRGDCVSSFDEAHVRKWEKSGMTFDDCQVDCMSTEVFLDLFHTFFDFISIDVEGGNYDLLVALLNADLNGDLLCIEHDGRIEDIKALLPGCEELSRNSENLIIALP